MERITRRKIEFDRSLVLQHELGHFICLLRSLLKKGDESEIKRLYNKGSVNIVDEDSGYFTNTVKKANMNDEDIILNCLVGGMFFRLYYDKEDDRCHPEKIRKGVIDKECYYGGGMSDMRYALSMFGEEKVYRAFRRMKEWIGPDDIEFFKECREYCGDKDKIMVKYLMKIGEKYYKKLSVE